ncbi:hypothetical protein [Streptomyces sp. 4N124]|uniref:hypothetical protein n=1 Tax=Streptomyces sp. 4N124 TaxID=3457420 RepID=UPI003FCF0F5A
MVEQWDNDYHPKNRPLDRSMADHVLDDDGVGDLYTLYDQFGVGEFGLPQECAFCGPLANNGSHDRGCPMRANKNRRREH